MDSHGSDGPDAQRAADLAVTDGTGRSAAEASTTTGALYPLRQWRKADTPVFLALVGAVVVLALGGIVIGQPFWGLGLALTAGVAGLAALGIVHQRRVLFVIDQERRHCQALATLHAILPLRAPLPPMAGWAATPELAAVVAAEILARRPRRVVEVGSGVTTLVAGYALQKVGQGGRLVSLDHDAAFAAETRRHLARHGLSEVAEVFHAPLVPVTLGEESSVFYATKDAGDEPIDMFIVDGPPSESRPLARYPAVPVLWDRLSDRAVVILDDARRPDEQEIVARWQRDHPDLHLEWVSSVKGIAILSRTAPGEAA